MNKILNFSEIKAKQIEDEFARKEDLRMLVETLDLAYKTLLYSKHPGVYDLKKTLYAYKKEFKKELDAIIK